MNNQDKFLKIKVESPCRWDLLAYHLLEDASRIPELLALNTHLPVSLMIPKGSSVYAIYEEIGNKERVTDSVPPWER